MSYRVKHCAIVVLAAGLSSRLGKPKQVLVYNGKSLLNHAVDAALETGMRPVIVVVGANADEVVKGIEKKETEIVKNEYWQEGITSSLRCGLEAMLKKSAHIDGIIFMVCDQPYITKSLLESLLQAQHKTGLPIVASSYDGDSGTPTLFHKKFFAKLMELKGDTGARKLIKQHEGEVASVAFPKGIIDIDTEKDYEELLK